MIEKRSVPPYSLFSSMGYARFRCRWEPGVPAGGNNGCAAGICRKHGFAKQALRPEGVISFVKRPFFKLTKSEMEIMDLLWKEQRPLCRSEIIALSPDRSWKAGSIHILLNSMLDKGAVQVAGFVQSTKNYARTFLPQLTSEEYMVMQIQGTPGLDGRRLAGLTAALIGEIGDRETLDRLEHILQEKKRQLS